MEKLVFATNNKHKLSEVRAILGKDFDILSLSEINCFDEIPETADTLDGNAEQKALWILEKYGYDCFADDTGLEIEALDGRPGVYSARYAGEDCSFKDNNEKVLLELQEEKNREAKFRTVICLKLNGKTHFFSGEVEGRIIEKNRGNTGFGYDPIFVPEGYSQSFAELGDEIKNKISHRYRATKKLVDFLSH
ncbi:MAG: non-canonical purine NTP pyrophosphatase [Bacteroidetes bacterium]|nr:MAG: non-canonical purine NTP pyrophosphatase [Bacteroidota bacterium]